MYILSINNMQFACSSAMEAATLLERLSTESVVETRWNEAARRLEYYVADLAASITNLHGKVFSSRGACEEEIARQVEAQRLATK